MSTFNKLRKIIQEEIKKVINESDDDPKQARKNAFDLTDKARSVAGYKAKIPAYEKALAAHQKAASLMKSPADKKEHLSMAKKLQLDIERFKADMNSGDGAFRSDMKNEAKNEDPFVTAMELGELAFENGKQRVPAYDKKLMDLIYSADKEKYQYSSRDLMKAWLDGWDARNIAAPVDGLDESDDLSDIPFPKPQFEYAKLGQWYQFDDDAYRVVVTDSSEVGMKSSSGKWKYLAPEELNGMLESNKAQLISDKSEIAGLEFKLQEN